MGPFDWSPETETCLQGEDTSCRSASREEFFFMKCQIQIKESQLDV